MASTAAHTRAAVISAFKAEPLFDDKFSLLDEDTHLLAAIARAESIEIYS
jgi:hypothetical protein